MILFTKVSAIELGTEFQDLQSVYKRSLGLEAMHSALRHLVEEVVEWDTEEKNLKNLHNR
jgi:hypothetical protein